MRRLFIVCGAALVGFALAAYSQLGGDVARHERFSSGPIPALLIFTVLGIWAIGETFRGCQRRPGFWWAAAVLLVLHVLLMYLLADLLTGVHALEYSAAFFVEFMIVVRILRWKLSPGDVG